MITRRTFALFVLAGTGLLAACGSTSARSGAVVSTAAPASTAAATTSAVATTAASTTLAPTTTTEAPTTTGAPAASGADSEFCVAAQKQLDGVAANVETIAADPSPEAMLAYADEAERQNKAFEPLVPASIRAVYDITLQASQLALQAIRSAGGDSAKLPSAMAPMTELTKKPEFIDASLKWGAFLKDTCGIDVSAALGN